MKLIRTVVTEGSFKNLLRQAKTGDVIELYQGPYNAWCAHPDGVNIMRKGLGFRINGTRPFNGQWDNCLRPHTEVIGDQLWIVDSIGNKLSCIGKKKKWVYHPKGITRITKNGILLNGEIIIYPGAVDEVKFHPNGTLCRMGNKFFLVVSKG